MIESKTDYEFYLKADQIALGIEKYHWPDNIIDEKYAIWRFQRLLRKIEYYLNCKPYRKTYIQYLKWKFYAKGRQLGFSIHPNVFGPGLSIAHSGTLIVNGNARVGENCRIHNCVHLATQAGSPDECPALGNNIFIGPGTTIVGNIEITDGIVVGANSLVNRSFLEKNITIAGNPARKISDIGSHRCYGRATETLRANGSVQLLEFSNNHLIVRNTSTQT